MIKRESYMKKIRPFIDKDIIKVITGIRRSGKSVMLELIKDELISCGIEKNRLVTINFEDMRNRTLRTAETLHERITEFAARTEGKIYLFFDEIQEVKDWEKCVNSFRLEFDCDIYITGSNAKLLSGELATYIAGRYVEIVIYPFSFSEFVEVLRNEKGAEVSLRKAFREYIELGGMPFLSNIMSNREACIQYLADMYNSVVLKDIVMRNSIRDTDLLARVMSYVLANIGHTFSATGISKYFKSERRSVSTDTVLNYLKACGEAFLFHRVSRYDLKGKKMLSVNEKYYVADHGLREAVFGWNNADMDQVLENIVCMEMLRRGYSVSVGISGEKEIDFICVKNGKKIYLQVCYLLASEDTVKREFGVFADIKDNFPKYVLSLDEFDMGRDGIIHMNIVDFLITDEKTK